MALQSKAMNATRSIRLRSPLSARLHFTNEDIDQVGESSAARRQKKRQLINDVEYREFLIVR